MITQMREVKKCKDILEDKFKKSHINLRYNSGTPWLR